MSDDEHEATARELQAQPHPHGPHRGPPPWLALTDSSKAYWLAKARAGERPCDIVETPLVAPAPAPPQNRRA